MRDFFMYYIYILYSTKSDKYYVGYSGNPFQRLQEHNTGFHTTYTSKHRPWVLKAIFKCGEDVGEVIRMERFIKSQRSRKFLERLCDPEFLPEGKLSQLARVPHMRD